MIELYRHRGLSLHQDAPVWRSPSLPLEALTATLRLIADRPTQDATVQIDLVVTCEDGTDHRVSGSLSGPLTRGVAQYALSYDLPVHFDDKARAAVAASKPVDGYFRDIPLTRLGELGRLTARVELTLLRGFDATLRFHIEALEAPAPLIDHKNSVAFDATTSAQETGGDGVLSLTHTATGSERAVFAGVATNDGDDGGNAGSTSCTYGGTSMTELWDVAGLKLATAGYMLAAPATGAQTVTSTTAPAGGGSIYEHGLGVVSFTGVDQTTPAGTPSTASGTATSASVTAAGAGASDMVVDVLLAFDTPTIGADQTLRCTQDLAFFGTFFRMSTQPGANGGVMSWTIASSVQYGIGAVVVKASTAGATPNPVLLQTQTRIPASLISGSLLPCP